MAKRGIKIKEGEDLSPSNVECVIEALSADKPITKKRACEMLRISYNTTRLNRIIEEFQERKAYVKKRKQQMKSKPIDNTDRQYIVQEYLSGTSIAEIAEGIFRSPNVVKNILKSYNIPIRNKAYDYFNPVFLEDGSDAEDYVKGDLVFSARYNSPAYIHNEVVTSPGQGKVYRIWLLGDHSQWAYQPYYELADLRRLQQELKLRIHELDKDDMDRLIVEGLLKANKKLKKVSND